MSPPTSPLKSRDVNTSSPTKPTGQKSTTDSTTAEKPKSMEYHRQVLQSRLDEENAKSTYISPSDMIMSPATKKLEALKGKRFGKAKPQSLFANTMMSKNANAAANGSGSGSLDAELGKAMKADEKKEEVVVGEKKK
ncbi:MAG: hypothetical protein Q9220_004581 [cf. Caloplaca sp. 1 TL-2023]